MTFLDHVAPRRTFAGIAFVLVGALATIGCGGNPQASAAGVPVTLRDFAVDVATTLPAGSNTLAITNSGAAVHELEIAQLPAGADPASIQVANNVADLAGAGVTIIDEAEDIAPSTHTSLTVDLPAGTYVFLCNVPTHYGLGMHTVVTVE